ncbi:hypothetical protein C2S52_020092 [Perilla frutescens var. hirtella]|nr:hypothetical protein C2S52_020092 [Perilla frutescens var. hirtella]
MNEAAVDPSHLLIQLEDILESDPHIDEVGFIHPTQFAVFSEEVHSSPSSSFGANGSQLEDETSKSEPVRDHSSDTYFWHNDHKLGISTLVLVRLYRVAKDAFMDSYKRYRMLSNSQFKKNERLDDNASMCSTSFLDVAEIEVMRHSRALLLLSCDFGTAWNSRKLIVSKKPLFPMFMDELLLSALVLSYSPKSERAWSHRRWVIKMIAGKCANLPETVKRESELVKKIVENSKMNYRAWNHRCWLVSYMAESQVLLELQSSRDWAALHVADNSCFHYRARLLAQMIENSRHNKDPDSGGELRRIWKEELDWDAMLIRQYVGRESLWLHRRFLSLLWMKHLAIDDQSISSHSCSRSSEIWDLTMFIEDETMLFHSCIIIPDGEFGDYQAQATFSATYITWLAKQMPMYFGVVLQESSQFAALKQLLDQAGKSCLWDCANASCGSLHV